MSGGTGPGLAGVWLAIAGVSGAVAVGAGAYASHGLSDPRLVELVRTASNYQLWHAVLLVALAAATAAPVPPGRWTGRLLTAAAAAIALGQLMFCGALYAIAATGVRGVGAVAPIGGVALMVGWALVALAGIGWLAESRRPSRQLRD